MNHDVNGDLVETILKSTHSHFIICTSVNFLKIYLVDTSGVCVYVQIMKNESLEQTLFNF